MAKKVVMKNEDTFLSRFFMLFSDTGMFFERIKLDRGIGKSLLILFLASLIGGVFSSIVLVSTLRGYGGFAGMSVYSGFGVVSVIYSSVFTLIASFIYAGTTHLFIMMFKGRGGFSGSFNVIAYGMIPYVLLSSIPLSFLIIIYSVYLIGIGFNRVHGISYGRAFTSAIAPLLIILVLLFFIVLSLFGYLIGKGFY